MNREPCKPTMIFFLQFGSEPTAFAFASVHVYVPPSLSRARAPSPPLFVLFEVLFLDLGRSGSDRFGLARMG